MLVGSTGKAVDIAGYMPVARNLGKGFVGIVGLVELVVHTLVGLQEPDRLVDLHIRVAERTLNIAGALAESVGLRVGTSYIWSSTNFDCPQ